MSQSNGNVNDLAPRICENKKCHNRYQPKRKWQKFCCPKCQFQAWDEKNPRMSKIKANANTALPR